MFGWIKPNTESKPTTLSDLPRGSIKFISIKECIGFIEGAGEQGDITSFLILFNSKTTKFVGEKTNKYAIKVFIKDQGNIEPLNVDKDLIERILFNKEVEVFDPPKSYEEHTNIKKQIEKKLSLGYQRLAGRPLSLSEKELIINSFGEYIPKKVNNKHGVRQILNKLLNDLAFSQAILQRTVNAANFDRISQGVRPKDPNLLFYGPGGTGKSELLINLAKIYEEYFGCFVAYQNETTKQLLKGSVVEGSKGMVGAYEDTYVPILRTAIKEARKRGVPSIIPIDEGDIFIKDPKQDRNPHSEDVINFFKSYAGNYDELMFIISCNLTYNELDVPATRDGRMNPLYIGPPELKEMKKLFRDIFLHRYISNDKLEISPQLEDSDIELICENLVNFQVTGANINSFFTKLTSKKRIDFENIDDSFTLEDMYLRNTVKTILSKEEFFMELQNYFGRFENYRPNNGNSNNDNSQTVSPELTQLFIKIKNQAWTTTYQNFFSEGSKKALVKKITRLRMQFHPDRFQSAEEIRISTKVLVFLNYCYNKVKKENVSPDSVIGFEL